MTATETSTEMIHAPANGAPAPAAETVPQYLRGFDGIACEAFPESARKVLAEPVNPHDVEIKPDGIVFLPGVAYRRILTRAFGAGAWALAPRSPARVMGNIVVYHGALYCLGRFVAEAVGECFYREGNANMSYASCVEGAKTDALSRCCKDLGIATEMWDANWREQWKAQYAVSYRGKKWDGRKQAEVETTLWKLKARVSNPHDLMAGAGGVAPPEPPKPASAPAAAVTPAFDDGTAGTPEQYAEVASQFKRLKWKRGYVRTWLKDFFGVDSHEALTVQQIASATTMLVAAEPDKDPHECPAYVAVAKRLQAEGKVA